MTLRTKRSLAALAALLALGASSGLAMAAVSMVNRDDKDHKLTVIEDGGAKSTDHVLKPSQLLEGVCANGCVVRLNDSEEDEYQLEAGDKVSIEEGYLYYEEPESAPAGSEAGTASKPAPVPGQAPAPAEAPKKP